MTTAIAVRLARSFRPRRPLSATRVIGRCARRSSLERAHDLEHLLRARLGELAGDAPVGQKEDAVRDRRRPWLVGDHHDRLAVGLARLTEKLEDLAARARVKIARGLV